tara:strand:+ start:80 stop:451 length:372 start_codon:yes stop_codon:yes gene_type:complete
MFDSESYIENLFLRKKTPVSKKKESKKNIRKNNNKKQTGGKKMQVSNKKEDIKRKLKKLKFTNLKQIAGKLNINKEQAKKYGKCSCKNTYIKAINKKLKQSGGSYDGYCHNLISQCSDSFAQC